MIDSMYQAEIDRNLDQLVTRPLNDPLPARGAFSGFWRAGGAVPAGVLDAAADVGDVAQGVGQINDRLGLRPMAGAGLYTVEDFDRAAGVQDTANARPMDWTSPWNEPLRSKAKDFMPDPQSTGAATQATAGVLHFAAEAVPAMALGGPMGPAVVGGLNADEEADRLREQGVDLATRSKAAAVAGVGAGVSMVLPMSGATRWARAAKGAAGGAAAVAGQAEGEKLVLEHAGYDKIADQFDPLNPTSLALSSIVPAAFGAAFGHAPARASSPLVDVVRNIESDGNRFAPDGKLTQSPKGALGEMQVMPATAADPGYGIKPAARGPDGQFLPDELARVGVEKLAVLQNMFPGEPAKVLAAYNAGEGAVRNAVEAHGAAWLDHMPDETRAYVERGMRQVAARDAAQNANTVAGARVNQAADAIDASRLTEDGDIVGQDAHAQAVAMAFDQIGRGEPVDVSAFGDSLLGTLRESRAIDDQVQALEDHRAQLLADAGNALEPGEVRTLRQQMTELQSQRPDDSAAAVKARAKELQGKDVSYKQASGQAQRELAAQVADHEATLQRLQERLDSHARAAQALEQISGIERTLEATQQRAATLPGPRTSPRRLALALSDVFDEMRAARGEPSREAVREAQPEAFKREANADMRAAPSGPPPAAPAPRETPPAASATRAAGRDAGVDVGPSADEIERLNPDMLVHLDGMAEPVRVADLMAAVREEAAHATRDARLLEIAAQCAIGN